MNSQTALAICTSNNLKFEVCSMQKMSDFFSVTNELGFTLKEEKIQREKVSVRTNASRFPNMKNAKTVCTQLVPTTSYNLPFCRTTENLHSSQSST